MKAISKIITVVCLTIVSLSGNAQEVKNHADLKPIKKEVARPVPAKRSAKTQAAPANMKKPVRMAVPAEKRIMKKEAIKE